MKLSFVIASDMYGSEFALLNDNGYTLDWEGRGKEVLSLWPLNWLALLIFTRFRKKLTSCSTRINVKIYQTSLNINMH